MYQFPILFFVLALLWAIIGGIRQRSNPRRVYEVILRAFLALGIGLPLVLEGIVRAGYSAMSPWCSDPEAMMSLQISCFLLGLGIAGTCCLFKKIFWFGTSLIAAISLISRGCLALSCLSEATDSLFRGALCQALFGDILPSAIAVVVMLIYFKKYVQTAR
jgi:hypothetical protein